MSGGRRAPWACHQSCLTAEAPPMTGPSPSVSHPWDSVSAQILNSQFGTIRKKKTAKEEGRRRVRAGKFSSDLSEIISPRTAGSLPVPAGSRHSGDGGVSAGPCVRRSQACAAARLSLTQLDGRGQAERRERERETGERLRMEREPEMEKREMGRDGEPRQTAEPERKRDMEDRRSVETDRRGRWGGDEERGMGEETDRQTTDWQGL